MDFTRQWPMADVKLLTQNSCGLVLHTSKAFLATFSPHFQAMFSGEDKGSDVMEVTLPAKFSVVNSALQILLQTGMGPVTPRKTFSLAELEDLHSFAKLCDIPFIRQLCRDQMGDGDSQEQPVQEDDGTDQSETREEQMGDGF